MKLLGLLRHAKSDWDDVALRDFDRGLSARGRRGAELMGRHISGCISGHISNQNAKWDLVLASPAARVKETLDASRLVIPTIWEERAYLADSDALMALLQEQAGENEPDALLLAAHNPGLQELALRLDNPDSEDAFADQICIKYPTGSFSILQLDIETWADCRAGCGKITGFTRPRDLDPELGPDRR